MAVIESGRVRYAGPPRDAAAALAGVLEVKLRVLDEKAAPRAAEVLGAASGVERVRVERDVLRFDLRAPAERVPELHKALVLAEVPVYSFEVAAPGLESLFLRVTEGKVS